MRKKKKSLPGKGFVLGFVLVTSLVAVLLSTGTVKVLIDASSVSAETPSNYINYKADTSAINPNSKNILFFSSSWCGSCGLITNTLKNDALKFPNLNFYEINIEENRDLSNTYKAYITPALVLSNDERPIVYQEISVNDIDKIVSKFASE